MANDRIEIRDADFAVAVPFGFITDLAGRLVVVGDALRRRLDTQPGVLVADLFEVIRPWRVSHFRDLSLDPKATVVLRAMGSALELKGSTLAIDDGKRVAFMGSAVVRDIEEFQHRGLQISDFPPSDATPDLLLSMQATRSALDDARRLGADLKTALAEARTAMEAKARFLAMMSHEIRTPLNGFGSMIDLMRDATLDADQRENLDTMDRCARSLMVLVNDILEFSKLEADRVEIVRQPTSVVSLMHRIVDHFRAAARERQLDLRLDVDVGDVHWVEMDGERVRQVMVNLIGNAIKFTPAGGISVRVEVPGPGELAVDVRDTGIGIAEGHRAHLFEPFIQADTSTTRRFGGTGLGLAICRQLAHAMGGDVELVRSDPQGSWFRFWFAAPACDALTTTPCVVASDGAGCENFGSVSVLVAEDDGTNQLIARKLLQKLDIVPTVVDDGEAAVEAAKAQHFDLILMDLMMPKLGGVDATRQIRSAPGPCRDVPIIAFSAATFDADRDAASAAGMTGFIEKPARLDALRKILAEHLPQRAAGGDVGGGATAGPRPGTDPASRP